MNAEVPREHLGLTMYEESFGTQLRAGGALSTPPTTGGRTL